MTVNKETFISILVIIFTLSVDSHIEIEAEDYFFPLEPVVNYCKIADQCQHDFVKICGQDATGTVKYFKDNCDLYEYNCDEKKQFRHVDLTVCLYNDAALGREEEKRIKEEEDYKNAG